MDQDQFRVSFSLRSKLLISVLSLLIIVIGFLNVSTIFLLRDDKRAYIYQVQSTEALLAGKDFNNRAQLALDTLRLSLAAINPRRKVTKNERAALQDILDNQSNVVHVSIDWVNRKSKEISPVITSTNSELLKTVGAKLPAKKRMDRVLRSMAKEKKAYGLFNLSRVGGQPLLGVALADVKLKSTKGLLVALCIVSLKDFGNDIAQSNLTIANSAGAVLFDTDPTITFSHKNIAKDPLYKSSKKSQVASGAQEYEDENNNILGSYLKPGLGLVVLTKTTWRKAMRATYALVEKFIILGGMAIGAAIIFAILFAKTLTAPISRLYNATKEVAAGNFNLTLERSSKDEIGALSESFSVMSKKINGLIQESMDKVRLEGELEIASTVQQTLIPPPVFQNDNILIRSHYEAAQHCGGDWWGFFEARQKMAVFIADATGHGLSSALLTASARSCFSVVSKLAQENPNFTFSPGWMLSYANRVVYDAASGKLMMTFFAGVIDFEKRVLTFASAGHNPPWLFKKKDNEFNIESLVGKGQRLGESPDVEPYEERSITYNPGDILFLYTDGIMEGTDPNGKMYSKKQVKRVIESNLEAGPEKMVTSLITDFKQHNGNKPLDDDITLAIAMPL